MKNKKKNLGGMKNPLKRHRTKTHEQHKGGKIKGWEKVKIPLK